VNGSDVLRLTAFWLQKLHVHASPQ